MLSLHQLTDSTDLSFCMDNEALFDINQRQLKIANPDFKDLNRVRRAVLTRCRPLCFTKITPTSFTGHRPRHVWHLDDFAVPRPA